ncbi:hypothetical protein [Streptomyces sp. NPDC051219]|uniref:hypothetical protein n=1 Tax=Streptomyces sp. NPDC051219 TaxID=3155283 RepID=UPI003419EB68
MPAAQAFAARDLPPLPAVPARSDEPGTPPPLDTETDPAPGIDVAALEFLAAAAAATAHRMLAEALTPGHEQQPLETALTAEQDAVRLAARRPGGHLSARLAAGTGRERTELALAVRAWEYGGSASLAVLEEEWSPGPEALARARASLEAAWDDDERPRLRATRNRWTVVGTGTRLRYGHDGRWWPYRKEGGRWTPAGPADHDPAAALAMPVV